MAFSKSINSYPLSLIKVAEQVCIHGIEVPIECGTEKAARRMRHKLYGLRYAYLHPENKDHPMHSLAGVLFACTEASILRVMPGTMQPDEVRFADAIDKAIEEARAKAGIVEGPQ